MTVLMRHPDLPEEQQIEVGEAAVPLHRAAGWLVVEPPEPAPAPVSKHAATKRRRAVSDEENH